MPVASRSRIEPEKGESKEHPLFDLLMYCQLPPVGLVGTCLYGHIIYGNDG
ncbi:hypothetical protein UY3_18020 [Chelonia mydas]|uniref:Uncharacterized protein n=1 Tax=Chelonia mydas TaxID=8469 RepID=M7AKK8_CHEMY|nr:hypothetical protein UY3_18020 [Chelonia mydas]